jgi:hypothetical protein
MTLTFQSGETLSLFPSIHNVTETTHFCLLAQQRVFQAEERARKAEYRAIKAEADRRVLLAENSALLLRAENRALRLRHAEAMIFRSRSHTMDYESSETFTRMNWKMKKKTRYRFPWLQPQVVAVGDDVFNHIMTFVEERAMFKFRRVNKACYHLFYSRQNYNDTNMVMKLAGMGRQFSKLKNLLLPKLTTEELCCLTQLQFPKLETISMPFLDPHEMRFLPAHRAVKILSEVRSAHSITEERFPNLIVLRMYKSKNQRLRGLHPHSKIEILDLNCNLDERGYGLITREKFPSLRSLKLYQSRDLGRVSNQSAWVAFTARLQGKRIDLRLV